MRISTESLTLDDVMVDAPADGVVVDPREWFARGGAVELEIGSGKGGFLVRRALDRPELNLVGIEWANKFFKYAADRMVRRGIGNVRLMRADAAHLVKHHLAPECLSALHVYHPDPWPKKRHHKRRLFQTDFIDAAIRCLAPGARWAIQTDHAEYFEVIDELLRARRELQPVDFYDAEFGVEDESIQTNFEIKYAREGREFHRLAFRKRSNERV